MEALGGSVATFGRGSDFRKELQKARGSMQEACVGRQPQRLYGGMYGTEKHVHAQMMVGSVFREDRTRGDAVPSA